MASKSPYFAPCKDVWLSYYKQTKGEDWYWTAKDAVALHQLMKKIESKLVGRSMEVNAENMVNSVRAFFGSITDKWQIEHLELCKVNSNFNSLYASAVRKSPLGVGEIRTGVEEFIRQRNNERAG